MDSRQLEKIIEDVRKDKQKLIQIILEKTDFKTCIQNIRQVLLGFWAEARFENSVDSVSETIEFKKQLLDIIDMIRSTELNDEEKIDRISNILI